MLLLLRKIRTQHLQWNQSAAVNVSIIKLQFFCCYGGWNVSALVRRPNIRAPRGRPQTSRPRQLHGAPGGATWTLAGAVVPPPSSGKKPLRNGTRCPTTVWSGGTISSALVWRSRLWLPSDSMTQKERLRLSFFHSDHFGSGKKQWSVSKIVENWLECFFWTEVK